MSRERWFFLVGAAGSVLGDIILAILATRPGSLYFLPWILVGTIMVAAKTSFDLFEERMATKSGRPAASTRRAHGTGEVIRGRRQGAKVAEPDYLLLFYAFLFSVGLALFGTLVLFGRIGAHGSKAIAAGLPLALVGWIALAVFYRFAYGIHAQLSISSEDLSYRGRRGDGTLREHLSIRWDEVVDFRVVENDRTDGPWLVAVPPPGSPLIFRGPTSKLYDADDNLILICNLDDAGIGKHVATGAINYWRPVSPPTTP
ncbi:MAG TPA: hypothetical protein VMU95_05050 [Trebonia sp.]|nr:hypothetical protein [Trebonia sp.]